MKTFLQRTFEHFSIGDMTMLKKTFLVACIMSFAGFNLALGSVHFEIGSNGPTGNRWSLGSGWGTDYGQLDAVFSIDPNLPSKSFWLNQGQTKSFNFGSVQLREYNIDPASSGNANETDNLNVTGYLFFDVPAINGVANPASVIAFPGQVNDSNTDLKILFSPVYVNFGNNGKLKIELSDLIFKSKTTECVTACVTLLCEPRTDVPEPASAAIWLLLAGLGLAIARKKYKSASNSRR
jgi:hypothetical protein